MTLNGVVLLNLVPQSLYVRRSRKQELRQKGAFQRTNSSTKFRENVQLFHTFDWTHQYHNDTWSLFFLFRKSSNWFKKSMLSYPEWDFVMQDLYVFDKVCKINMFHNICDDPSGRAV